MILVDEDEGGKAGLMEEFFSWFKEIRQRHAADASGPRYLHLVSKFYLDLMQASAPLPSSVMDEIEDLLRDRPSGPERLHHLWLLNGLSRYQWFVLENEAAARKTMAQAAVDSEQIFSLEFARFSKEIKMFPLFLALNTARVSSRAGRKDLAIEQFRDLEKYIENPQSTGLENFPVEVREILCRQAEPLSKLIDKDVREYFKSKMISSKRSEKHDAP